MKRILYLYERAMWYVGVFLGEFDKPLTIFKYTSYAGILLKLFGVEISIMGLVVASGVAIVVALSGGVILVKTGLIAYVQTLNNSQNPELLRILKHLDTQNGK